MNQSRTVLNLFISYARLDFYIAKKLKEDLERRNFHVWLDQDNIKPTTRWDNTIRSAIKQSDIVLYLVSTNSRTSPNVANELDIASLYDRPILPLWIEGNTKWADVLIMGYSRIQGIDMRGERYIAKFQELLEFLEKKRTHSDVPEVIQMATTGNKALVEKILHLLSPLSLWIKRSSSRITASTTQPHIEVSPFPSDSTMLHNPYKGLHAFQYEDAQDFFGREQLVHEMVKRIEGILEGESKQSQSSRCMLILGASGSGKSSAVMAGLLPALQKNQYIPEIKRWFFLEPVVPGEQPVHSLAHTLNLSFLNKRDVGLSPLEGYAHESILKELNSSPSRGLHELLQRISTDSEERVVLVIDQFEELFAPSVKSEQREHFMNLLSATATEPYTRILIIVTLRADFYDQVLKYPQIFNLMKDHQVDIPPMEQKEIRAVIEKPAHLPHVGVTFEPDLVGDLVNDMRERPEALPLLQFTLEKLFERGRKERHLTTQHYNDIGGLEGAINKHAEATYSNLSTEEHRKCAEELFTRYFIHIREPLNDVAHFEGGEEIVRRRVTQKELQLDKPQHDLRRETIEAFTKARLLTVKSTVRQNAVDSTYEISHEALITAWKRFYSWIESNREDIFLRQRLRTRIADWRKEENLKKKQKLLLSTAELKQLQEHNRQKNLDQLEEAFYRQSKKYRRRQRIDTIVSIFSLIIIVCFLSSIIIAYTPVRFIFSPSQTDPTVITSLSDDGPGSLRQVSSHSNSGATLTFAPQLWGKTIHLTSSDLSIDKKITILGPINNKIQISTDKPGSNKKGRSVYIRSNGNVTFENIAFVDSYPHKNSLLMNEGTLTLNNCELHGNETYGDGGAVTNKGQFGAQAHLNINNGIIESNIASGSGGGIYNLFGIVNINRSTIRKNIADNNGGGLYSQGGIVTLSQSKVSSNTANDSSGGGVTIVNGSLSIISGTEISDNVSDYGGGVAVQGSIVFITDSSIDKNTAHVSGGGISVVKNTDNNFSSLVTIRRVTVTDRPNALYYIGHNNGTGSDKDIAGKQTTVGATLQISSDDTSTPIGNPPPQSLPQTMPNLLGVANIDAFCQRQLYSYGTLASEEDRNADDINITCFTLNRERLDNFSGQQVCESQYPVSDSEGSGNQQVTDFLANYFDPTSLQCYKNLKKLGPIGGSSDDFDKECKKDSKYTGLYNNVDAGERTTAYDWKCQPKSTEKNLLPGGIRVADACNIKYGTSNAIYRLVNYNRPDGWECWAPA